jgi:hypothetical protein
MLANTFYPRCKPFLPISDFLSSNNKYIQVVDFPVTLRQQEI